MVKRLFRRDHLRIEKGKLVMFKDNLLISKNFKDEQKFRKGHKLWADRFELCKVGLAVFQTLLQY